MLPGAHLLKRHWQVTLNPAGAVPRKGEAMNNLTLILVGEALFWIFFTRRASFLHAVLLLFLVKCAWPVLKYSVLIEFHGGKWLWNRYVLHHSATDPYAPLIRKEMANVDKELAKLTEKGE